MIPRLPSRHRVPSAPNRRLSTNCRWRGVSVACRTLFGLAQAQPGQRQLQAGVIPNVGVFS